MLLLQDTLTEDIELLLIWQLLKQYVMNITEAKQIYDKILSYKRCSLSLRSRQFVSLQLLLVLYLQLLQLVLHISRLIIVPMILEYS